MNDNMEQRVRKLEIALFGDREVGNIGMEAKLDEMYQIFKGASFSWMLLVKIIIGLGTIAIFIEAFLKIVQFWKR